MWFYLIVFISFDYFMRLFHFDVKHLFAVDAAVQHLVDGKRNSFGAESRINDVANLESEILA